MKRIRAHIAAATALLSFAAVNAQSFDLSWHTIDGGGAMFSSGGALSLGGTVGQPDAGSFTAPLSGGAFELVGGFWPAGAACSCPGDMNGDGLRNGRDIQRFVHCLTAGGSCACADVDATSGVSISDIPVFVTDLLAGNLCP